MFIIFFVRLLISIDCYSVLTLLTERGVGCLGVVPCDYLYAFSLNWLCKSWNYLFLLFVLSAGWVDVPVFCKLLFLCKDLTLCVWKWQRIVACCLYMCMCVCVYLCMYLFVFCVYNANDGFSGGVHQFVKMCMCVCISLPSLFRVSR